MADYKEILRNKAYKVRELLAKYEDKLDDEKANSIRVLIENTFEITNGSLDALDYNERDKGIMNYHSQLDNALEELAAFEPDISDNMEIGDNN